MTHANQELLEAIRTIVREVVRAELAMFATQMAESEALARAKERAESGRAGGLRSGERRRARAQSKLNATASTKLNATASLKLPRSASIRNDLQDIEAKHDSFDDNALSSVYRRDVVDPETEEKNDQQDPDKQKRRPRARAARDTSPRGERDTELPGQAETIDAFHQRFKLAYNAKPTWNGKSVKLIQGLLRKHPAPEVIRRIAIMFDAPPSWLTPPFDLGTLVRFFDKLVAPAAPTQPPSAKFGRFEPPEQLDRSRPPWEFLK